ncbi:MAG: L,D-transpeptidase family protein [Candidatus Omnitrophica bacterium]|nr:L,D-transpeptidase family protein [Candidatus Omnitrophota bacterium]
MNQKILIGGMVGIILIVGGIFIFHHHKDAVMAQDSDAANVPVNQLLQQATKYEEEGQKLKAKQVYDQIINNYPDYSKIEDIQAKLGELNVDLIFSRAQMPQTIDYEVVPGDSLGKLARKYKTTTQLIKRANGLKSDVIRTGEKLRIWTAPFTVLVSKSQNVLFVKSKEEVVKIYHVSTGRDNITPAGTFHIASKIENPVWFKNGGAPIPSESPENELGTRWMGFDTDTHYGIHGTLHPESIGKQVTAGCVRLKNSDVEELFDMIPLGTEVIIQN